MHAAFKTHLLNDEGKVLARKIADLFDDALESAKALGVDGRELSLVTTKLEEACFFAKKSIAIKPENQLEP